ncbi:MAG TPA: hypothetical protein VK961_15205 [Chthoniobacter sp.]|nr:hypothetical protein [Chthoniobacter sp.]
MIQLLAQVTADPSPAAIKEWLGVVLYIAGIITAILGVLVLIKQLREKPSETPQPLIVQGHVSFTPLEDHQELAAELKAFIGTVDKRFVDQALASSASRDKIYGLIRAQGEKLQTEMKGDLGGVQRLLTDLFTAVGQLKGEIKHLQK